MRIKPCSCGSGKLRYENYDARGIFLCFTCSSCHKARMARYRPEVLTDSQYEADEPIDPEPEIPCDPLYGRRMDSADLGEDFDDGD